MHCSFHDVIARIYAKQEADTNLVEFALGEKIWQHIRSWRSDYPGALTQSRTALRTEKIYKPGEMCSRGEDLEAHQEAVVFLSRSRLHSQEQHCVQPGWREGTTETPSTRSRAIGRRQSCPQLAGLASRLPILRNDRSCHRHLLFPSAGLRQFS